MITVFTKIELNEKLKQSVVQALSSYLGHRVNINDVVFGVDESIIAGLKINIDSEIIDLTINYKLQEIINMLKS
jgi:F0F1-type ATP synthase delta subunit